MATNQSDIAAKQSVITPKGGLPSVVNVEHNSPFYDLHHVASDRQIDFDLTDFGNKEAFLELLESLDLPTEPVTLRRMDDMEEDRFVWANEQVILITTTNPKTGKFGGTGLKSQRSIGTAGSLTVMGEPETVGQLAEAVEEYAEAIKGRQNEDRQHRFGDIETAN